MKKYIDGFVFPISKAGLEQYKKIANQIAAIWLEYGAIEYQENLGEDLHLAGTLSFAEAVNPKVDELIVFGWVSFPSKAIRDKANAAVPKDPRMAKLVAPLVEKDPPIFDAKRMFYGGFETMVSANQ